VLVLLVLAKAGTVTVIIVPGGQNGMTVIVLASVYASVTASVLIRLTVIVIVNVVELVAHMNVALETVSVIACLNKRRKE
jgi:hypothetical protein